MQKRLLVFFGLFGALAGLILLIVFLLMEGPNIDPPIVDAPPGPERPPLADVQSPVAQDGTLKGKVVHGVTGDPIQGADVVAVALYTEMDEENKPVWGKMRSRKHIFTDRNGNFALEDLPPDFWNLWVEKPGFGFASVPRAKFKKKHVIKLYPAGSIRGRVIFPDEKPAPGCRIEYTPQGGPSEVFSRFRSKDYHAITGSDGRFRFDGLPPGKFTIEVYHNDYLPAPWTLARALKQGEDRDLGLHRLTGGFGMLVKVLYFGTNQPVPGIMVVVRPIGDPMPRTTTGQKRATDENGIARFQGLGGQVLKKPTFQVSAIVPGMGVVMPDIKRSIGPDKVITIFIRKSGVVKGKAQTANGKPVPYFFVFMKPIGHRQGPPTHGVGNDGEFAVYGVPEGNYRLIVQDAKRVLRDGLLEDVAVTANEEKDVGTIILEEGSEIAGVVSRSNGKPLGARVRVVAARKLGPDRWETVRTVYCAADGSYSVPGMYPGEYYLWPDTHGSTTAPVPVEIKPGQGFVEKNLTLFGEGFVRLRFDDVVDGKLQVISLPPTWLVEESTGKEIKYLGSGHRLRPGRFQVRVEVRLADGTVLKRDGPVIDVEEYERRPVQSAQEDTGPDPIRIRLDEIRHAAEAAKEE